MNPFLPLASLFSVAYGFFHERHRLERIKISHPSPYLPPALDGAIAAHLGDFHIDFFSSPAHWKRALRRLARLKPRLLFLSGDYVDYRLEDLDRLLPEIRALFPAARVAAVPGNHEYWVDFDRVQSIFRRHGLPLLVNEIARWEYEGGAVAVAGLDTHDLSNPLHREIVASMNPTDFNVVLAHNPDVLHFLDLDPIDLALFGHTHHGQVALPFISFPDIFHFAPYRYHRGLHQAKRALICVTPGIGVSDFPARFLTAPSIPTVTLSRIRRYRHPD